jgi:hypothetical protein
VLPPFDEFGVPSLARDAPERRGRFSAGPGWARTTARATATQPPRWGRMKALCTRLDEARPRGRVPLIQGDQQPRNVRESRAHGSLYPSRLLYETEFFRPPRFPCLAPQPRAAATGDWSWTSARVLAGTIELKPQRSRLDSSSRACWAQGPAQPSKPAVLPSPAMALPTVVRPTLLGVVEDGWKRSPSSVDSVKNSAAPAPLSSFSGKRPTRNHGRCRKSRAI